MRNNEYVVGLIITRMGNKLRAVDINELEEVAISIENDIRGILVNELDKDTKPRTISKYRNKVLEVVTNIVIAIKKEAYRVEEVIVTKVIVVMFPIENYEEINNDVSVVIYDTEVLEELILCYEDAKYDIKGKGFCIEDKIEDKVEVIDNIIDDNTIDTIIEEGKREIDILYRGKIEPISDHLVDLVLIKVTKWIRIDLKVEELILKELRKHNNILRYELKYQYQL